jgi:membrane protein
MQLRFPRLRKLWREGRELVEETGWRPDHELSALHKLLHFCVLVWRSFSRNRCPVRAAALAYTTLLALIPMLAIVMSITSTFLKSEGEEQIDHFIIHSIETVMPRAMTSAETAGGATNQTAEAGGVGTTNQATAGTTAQSVTNGPAGRSQRKLLPSFAQEEQAVRARRQLARSIHEFIRNTRSSALGITGTLALIFTAISMLGTIETTFNDIWGVARGRSWFTRVVVYWSVISLAPMLLALAVGLASGSHSQSAQRIITSTPLIGTLIFRLLPVVLLILALAAFYRFMPNTKVHWSAALVGGVLAGTLWHLNSLVSVLYVSRVVSNSRIYGSLGLVPVFMLGLYLFWWILLFGAQVAYAFQNRASYMEQRQVETIDQRGREVVALRVSARIARRFLRGEPPPTVSQMGKELNVPTRLIQELLQHLCAARLIVQTTEQEPGYLPARPLETITCHELLLALRTVRGQQLNTRSEPANSRVYAEFRRIEQAEREVAAGITLCDLAGNVAVQTAPGRERGEQKSLTE